MNNVDPTVEQTHKFGFLLSVLIFQQFVGAATFPISKYGLEYIDPYTFAFFRFGISSIILLLLVKIQKPTPPIEKKDIWKIISLGLIIIPGNQVMYLAGQSMTTAGHGALLFATVPVWIFIGAMLHLKEKPTLRRTVGIIIAVCGIIVIMTSGALELGKEYLLGDFIILLAVIAWAMYTIIGKTLVRKYGAIRVTAYALASGSLAYFPFGLYFSLNFDYSSTPISAWGSVLYMAIGTSVIAYVLWYWLLKFMEASRLAVFHNLQPLIASVAAYIWLNEPLGWPFVIGGVICLAGVLMAETK